MKKLRTDTTIHPHGTRDLVDVGADGLGELRHLVDKGDFRCKKGIRCVLDELRGFEIAPDERSLDKIERAIDILEDFPCLFIFTLTRTSRNPKGL